MKRRVYLSVFVLFSLVAGLLYYNHTRLGTAVVATRDLPVGTRIQDGDVSVRAVNPASVPGEVLRSTEQAIGQVVASPILEGAFVAGRQVASQKNAALLGAGLQLPPGYRIIGLPITPSAAVGGALKAGDLVDVMAVVNASKTPALGEPSPAPVMLGKNVLVIGLRTDQGTDLDAADHGVNLGASKVSTVLLAISPMDEPIYSSAIVNSSFVLALSTD